MAYNYRVDAFRHTIRADVKISKAGVLWVFRTVMLGALLLLPISAQANTRHLQLDSQQTAIFSSISLYPNIETAGVVVAGTGLPATAQLLYQASGDAAWRTGHPLTRIDDGRLVGSLFGLAPSTSYNVRVSDGSTEIAGAFTTQPDDLPFVPLTTLHVNANALPGGDGSAGAPYRTIQEAVNRASPGTQVLVADGIYNETISFPNSGNANNWIQVKAAGNGAILDGSGTLSGDVWQPVEGKSNVWFTRIGGAIGYLARDGKRFYQYNDLNGLNNSAGHNNVTIREGWFFEPSTLRLYVRSQDDPNAHNWQVPRFNHAFDVIARDWIWIEGFEMRFYGTSTNGCGVCTLNASHLVIRRNRIHNMQLGIFVQWNGADSQGNDTRIEFNEVFDTAAASWEWSAIKSGPMEGTGIIVRGHIGAIVRGNEVHHTFNGIYAGTSGTAAENPAIAFDADIYNNRIHNIGDDGLEPEGACINVRFRNNLVDGALAGISLAPITFGPVWVTRSVFANFTSKAVKWDRNSDGVVYFYHNTSWTNSPDASGMELISPVKNTVLRNNIFQVNGFSITEKPTGSINNDWNFNNWHSTRTSSSPHFKWENVNYDRIRNLCNAAKLECNGYDTAPGLVDPGDGNFTLLATSPNVNRGVPIPGINDSFSGSAPDGGAFELGLSPAPTQTSSPTPFPTLTPTLTQFPQTQIPTPTPSITPFTPFPTTGLPPTQTTPSLTPFPVDSPPTVLSVSRMDASPTTSTSVRFRVAFSENVTGVDSFAPIVDFALNVSGVNGASIAGITAESAANYIVQVNTGAGNGTVQLYVLDDDSIRDSVGQPLGGAGTGNGNFLNGESYTVSKPAPAPLTAIFKSVGSNDGWVLESQKTSESGGTRNASEATFVLGDDNRDRQYISILQFSTASLPDNAVVTKVTLMIRSQSYTGTNPFTTHQNIAVDIRKGHFGSSGLVGVDSLDRGDFQAPASLNNAGIILNNPVTDWYWTVLDPSALQFINLTGVTEFRLRFQLGDNADRGNDWIRFYSGNYNSSTSHPMLQIEYYVP
ncbi:MAG: right-handed parallel beta-helix repeat-containing protein [Chloroflexota bacterium]